MNVLTGQDNSEALERGETAGGSMTMDDCQPNLQRLRTLYLQRSDILDDTFYSFSFNFMQTVDFLLNHLFFYAMRFYLQLQHLHYLQY